MKNQIDWEKETFNTTAMLERAIILCMNRIEIQYCYDGESSFDSECATLMNLLNARQNEQRTAIKASDPKPR